MDEPACTTRPLRRARSQGPGRRWLRSAVERTSCLTMCDVVGGSSKAGGIYNTMCDAVCYFQAPQFVRIHGKRHHVCAARAASAICVAGCLSVCLSHRHRLVRVLISRYRLHAPRDSTFHAFPNDMDIHGIVALPRSALHSSSADRKFGGMHRVLQLLLGVFIIYHIGT